MGARKKRDGGDAEGKKANKKRGEKDMQLAQTTHTARTTQPATRQNQNKKQTNKETKPDIVTGIQQSEDRNQHVDTTKEAGLLCAEMIGCESGAERSGAEQLQAGQWHR